MSGSSHEFQSTVSAERSSIEFDSQEDENQQRIDCIRPRDRSFSEPVQTSQDENQQGIDNIRERLRSYSEDVQPSEYVNQLEEYNQPRLGPISEFEQANESSTSQVVQVDEYEYQQTIEDIQPRMRSMSRLDRAIEYENHKVDFIQSRPSPIPELEQANADEYEQGIEHVQPRQRSISTHMQPDEYENQQGMDNIHSRLSSISELEQINEYENQQGIDNIQSRLSSISELEEYENQQGTDNIQSRLSSISELEQVNEYENQQGIDNIQSRLSSISEYDDQEVIEYAPKLRSSTISESEQANEYEKKEIEYDHVKINSTTYTEMRKAQEVLENLQQVDFIQTKLRSTEVTDAHQQEKQGTDIPSEHADQDEHHQGIIYVPATESSTEKRSEEEIQQEKHDEVLNEFPEHKFIFRDLKSDEQLHW
ncbi:hypothetical protein DCAR_0313397 [Daucus carota subsp. sativus]|uniref:Uncharacterized protein n=1 Tax=Daucus carota subsp. sativus TaxID=79200 RepID=A0A166C008_DAUCS|nr:hypothetical protein DCAR_0313397 [Daucus carota subsp. sativus]